MIVLKVVRLIQRYYNRTEFFFFKWTIQLHTSLHFSRLKLLSNFYIKKTAHRQDFGVKFDLTYHNGVPVADILKQPLVNSKMSLTSTINGPPNEIEMSFKYS